MSVPHARGDEPAIGRGLGRYVQAFPTPVGMNRYWQYLRSDRTGAFPTPVGMNRIRRISADALRPERSPRPWG